MILALIGLFLLMIGCFIGYQLIFSGPTKTQPNTNDLAIGSLNIQEEILINNWNEPLPVIMGSLIVPESREEKIVNHISIGFIKISTQNPKPLAPIFFLPGGPGTPGSDIFRSDYFYLFKKLSEYADIILLDQRGTGRSIPNLSCRNSLALPTNITENIADQLFNNVLEACQECAEEFVKMGINLQGYNSLESAVDIEDLRKALGYESITLYGYSYGTVLAQHYIELFRDRVTNAILTGPLTPDLGLKLPNEVQRQFLGIDSLLKYDTKANKYVSSLTSLMERVHDDLQERPKFIEIPLMDAVSGDDGAIPTAIFKTISIFKPNWKITLTKTHLQMMMAQYIGLDRWIRRLPSFYYQMNEGSYQPVGNILRNFRRQRLPNALFFTVNGTAGYDPQRWADAISNEEANLLSHFSISFGRYPEINKAFKISKIPGLNDPIQSDVEILLIAGSLDGRTPLCNTDTLIRRFPNHKIVRVVNAGHNDLMDEDIMLDIIKFLKSELAFSDTLNRPIEFDAIVPHKFSILDTIDKIRRTDGIQAAIDTYQVIYKNYKDQDDYLFDLSEGCLNSYGYQLLALKELDDAIEIFKLNSEIYPERYNVYNSLGEAYLAANDSNQAERCFKKAIDLNYFDGYSHGLLYRLQHVDH